MEDILKAGDHVQYIPRHVTSTLDILCWGEYGIVSSGRTPEGFVFVIFDGDMNAKACDPNDLIFDWRTL